MIKFLVAAAALFVTAASASAESLGGYWLSAEGRSGGCAIVEFTKDGNAYNGKVVAILESDNKSSVGNFMFTNLRKKTAKRCDRDLRRRQGLRGRHFWQDGPALRGGSARERLCYRLCV